jgi:hypothetical protein
MRFVVSVIVLGLGVKIYRASGLGAVLDLHPCRSSFNAFLYNGK